MFFTYQSLNKETPLYTLVCDYNSLLDALEAALKDVDENLAEPIMITKGDTVIWKYNGGNEVDENDCMDKLVALIAREQNQLNGDKIQKDLGNAMSSILAGVDNELMEMSKEQLDEFYFFKWEDGKSFEHNTYQFQDLLGLYGRKCRRWEEFHNGSCCVVERVRDKYLMPKIKEFCRIVEQRLGNSDV